MYSTDEIRQEAIEKVQQWYAEGGMRPSRFGSEMAWRVLENIAKLHPSWRVGQYCLCSGVKEEQSFKREWEAWRWSVNL